MSLHKIDIIKNLQLNINLHSIYYLAYKFYYSTLYIYMQRFKEHT